MPAPSLARDLFDHIVNDADPVAAIRGLINLTTPTQETDWLDFKGEYRNPAQADPKHRERKFRETWSEALSGFANSGGGVLVWGVEARKTKVDGGEIDCACGEAAVSDPVVLAGRLVEWQRGATDPPLANVEVKQYPLPEDASKGFVVCYVPEGPFKPYRSEQNVNKPFYLRAADNFVVMPRPVLASLFYPRTKAVFKARVQLQWVQVETEKSHGRAVAAFACEVELVNEGTATAKDTFVLVQDEIKPITPPVRYTSALWSPSQFGSEREFQASRPLHRQRRTPLFKAEWEVEAKSSAATDYVVAPYCKPPSFDLAVYCENQEGQLLKIRFDQQSLLQPGPHLLEVKASE